jgi:hypothetical protein
MKSKARQTGSRLRPEPDTGREGAEAPRKTSTDLLVQFHHSPPSDQVQNYDKVAGYTEVVGRGASKGHVRLI